MNNNDEGQIVQIERTKDQRKQVLLNVKDKSRAFYEVVRSFVHNHSLVATDGANLRWNGKCWKKATRLSIENLIKRVTPPELIRDVEKLAKAAIQETYIEDLAQHLYGANRDWRDEDGKLWYLVNVNNGVIHIDAETGLYQLKEHDPKYCFTTYIGTGYDPKAKCDYTQKYLAQVLPEEDIMVALYWGSYIMLPHKSFQQAMYWYGSGENGKGTTSNIYRVLLPR